MNKTLSQQLDEIGYFSLIFDETKKKYLKQEIDKHLGPGHFYNGDKWLYIANDYYISDVYNLSEYQNGSSTSDFRAFEVYPNDLYKGNLESYINSAKVVFEQNNLRFDWGNEKMNWLVNNEKSQVIHHTVQINGKEYLIFSGEIRNYKKSPIYEYLVNFRKILNEVVKNQTKNYRVILLSAPDAYVYFILMDNNMIKKIKIIVKNLDNVIEY